MISAELLEQDFHSFFDSIGFSRVEKLVGLSPSFSNADYIDEKNKILVELKIIEKDFFKNGGIIDSLYAFVPVRVGKVQSNKNGLLAPGLYQIEMPPLNREGKRDSFEEPLRRSIKKANLQLKETNRILLDSKGYNVVMVALHMPTLIDIFSAHRLAEKLISEFSSIHAFLVCTPMLALKGDQVSCIHGVRSDVPEQIEKLIADIGDQFCYFFLHPGT